MNIKEHKNQEDTCSKVKKYVNELGIKCYSHVDLEMFTSNFSELNIVGFGAYGVVYKGLLLNGEQVAIKDLGSKDIVEETFMAEVSTMSNTNHRNLIKLKGYCFEPNMKALVYEYMEKGSLDNILYKPDINIKWEKLYSIAIEVAMGLMYFHDCSNEQIIHYDIKAGNVLLDKNLSPKITDFGLAKLIKRDVSEVPLSRIRGTQGYSAPELHSHGYGSKVTNKCDVYSFGMLLFEILGKRKIYEHGKYFPQLVWNSFDRGQLECLLNDIGITKENRENAKLLTEVALLCAQDHPDDRPTMKEVWLMLDKKLQVRRPSLPSLLWRCSTFSMPASSLELTSEDDLLISEDDLKGYYGSNERTIQDAESFSSSLKDNIPGLNVPLQEQTQSLYQPNTIEDGLEGMWEKFIYENGTTYEGTWKNGLRQGQGKFCWTNGDVYIGEWKDDLREGLGKFFWENGDYYEGTYKKSMKDGHGRLLWANGDEYIGEFANDFREGHGKFIWKNGNYHEGTYKKSIKEGEGRYVMVNGNEYIGEYRNGVREGHGRFHWENGDEYIGEYRNGVREGHGRFLWANGNEYIGEFKNDFREGQGKFIWTDGSYHEGTYVKSIREGQGRYLWANGNEYIGEYRNGVREGHGRFLWANGNEYIGEFRNDFREGHGKFICKSGDYHEGTYKLSIKEGQGRYHWANGNEYIGEYRNGVQEGHGRFLWANGDEYIGEFRNDFREGHGKTIWKNGNYHEGAYKKSIKEGQGRFVMVNGNEYIGEYRNGVREGQGRFSYKNGSYHEGTYRNGLKDGPGRFVSANGEEYRGEWIKGVRQ